MYHKKKYMISVCTTSSNVKSDHLISWYLSDTNYKGRLPFTINKQSVGWHVEIMWISCPHQPVTQWRMIFFYSCPGGCKNLALLFYSFFSLSACILQWNRAFPSLHPICAFTHSGFMDTFLIQCALITSIITLYVQKIPNLARESLLNLAMSF